MNYRDNNLKYVRNGEGRYILFLNRTEASWIEKEEEQEVTVQGFYYDEIEVEALDAERDTLISALIHTRYKINNEIALLRQKDIKPIDFQEYNDFAELCKVQIDEMLNR